MCCDDCEPQEFNTSLDSLSVAPEPSELTLTINNRGCCTAYILATLQQHSWDVWAVPCAALLGRSVVLWPVYPKLLRCMSLTESLRLREWLSAPPQETVSLIIFYWLNPFIVFLFFLTNCSQLPSLYLEWEESCLQNLSSYVYMHIILHSTHGCFSNSSIRGNESVYQKVPACAH